MNHQENIRSGGTNVTDNIPVGVENRPNAMNSATEEEMMSVLLQQRQNSCRAQQTNSSHEINEHHSQTQQPGLMANQNGPTELHRHEQPITQPYPHLSHPIPRVPNNFATGLPPHDQGNLAILHLIYQAPLTMDLLKIPEAISLQAALNNGQVAPGVLLHQVLNSFRYIELQITGHLI